MELNEERLRKRRKSTIVAILAMHDDLRPFRGNSQNFVDLIETGQRYALPIYVVTPRDLQLKRRHIYAYTYDKESGGWVRRQVPRPVVIYNRLPFRQDEKDPYVQEVIKQCIEHPHIQFYNPSFFNKWQLFQWLATSQKTKDLIPHTVQWGQKTKLRPLFARSPLIYLKPESGKAGAGVMQLRRAEGRAKPYRLKVQSGRSTTRYRFHSLKGLKQKLRMLIQDEQYIVQQGISLARYKRRPFDLRVLVQKNYKGKWTLTGIGARIAGDKSITTHVPRGGSIGDPQRLLRHAFGSEEAKRILEQVKIYALTIARQIEAGHRQKLGEMSMDIGVDSGGKIWFFEANSKPMKFDEPHIREKSLINTVRYCKYLTKQTKK